jgi:hypothetical protein
VSSCHAYFFVVDGGFYNWRLNQGLVKLKSFKQRLVTWLVWFCIVITMSFHLIFSCSGRGLGRHAEKSRPPYISRQANRMCRQLVSAKEAFSIVEYRFQNVHERSIKPANPSQRTPEIAGMILQFGLWVQTQPTSQRDFVGQGKNRSSEVILTFLIRP